MIYRMPNRYDLCGVDPVAKRIWRNPQMLGRLRDSKVIRQLFHFDAPRSVIPASNRDNITNLTKLLQ